MIRNPIAITTRSQLGAWACARSASAHMSRREAKLLNFGDVSPHPGFGGAPS